MTSLWIRGLTATYPERLVPVVNVFVWTYFAVSTMASSREAALCPTAQDDSRRPPALEDSITAASDMVLGSHAVTEREEWRGLLVLLISTCLSTNLRNVTIVQEGTSIKESLQKPVRNFPKTLSMPSSLEIGAIKHHSLLCCQRGYCFRKLEERLGKMHENVQVIKPNASHQLLSKPSCYLYIPLPSW